MLENDIPVLTEQQIKRIKRQNWQNGLRRFAANLRNQHRYLVCLYPNDPDVQETARTLLEAEIKMRILERKASQYIEET